MDFSVCWSTKHLKMRVPDGWFDYSRFGSPIDSTRIVAVKTPLKKQFNTGRPARLSGDYAKILRGVPVEEEFTPHQMLQQFEERGWNVGLVIDLTYTDRYYDPQDFICRGVRHLKIKCPGHVIPPDIIYQRLRAGISEFLSDPSNGDALVAVHCTHGLNRTGYLICRYLMERCGYSAERAIKAFNKGRGNDIERENYLEHLRKGCPKEDTQSCSPERLQPQLKVNDGSHHSRVQSNHKPSGMCMGDGLSHHLNPWGADSGRERGGDRRRYMYRKGTGQEWDLRMQLDYKAGRGSGKRGGRQEYADQGGWNERSSRKRSAHHMEDAYGVETDYQDYDYGYSWRPAPPTQHPYVYNKGATPGYHTSNYPTGALTSTGQSHYALQKRHGEKDIRRGKERVRNRVGGFPIRW